MCHSNNDDPTTRKQIRLAGIQGLQVRLKYYVSDYCIKTYIYVFKYIFVGRCEKNSF